MRDQVMARLESTEQILITTLGIDVDDVRRLFDSLQDVNTHDQVIALLDIDIQEDLPITKPEILRQDLWDIFAESDYDKDPHQLRLSRVSLLLFVLEIELTLFYIDAGHFDMALQSYGDACEHYGHALSRVGSAYGNGSSHLVGKLGAKAKLTIDSGGKQAAKQNVRDCWERWQKNRHEYKSKSAFARAMLDKYDRLGSQRVIERWCKEWESEPS